MRKTLGRGHRLRRSWGELAIGLACVVLAGFLSVRLDEEDHFTRITGQLGQPAELSTSGQTLTVHQVRASTRVQAADGGDPIASPGHFLAVTLLLETPQARNEVSIRCRLEQGDGGTDPAFASVLTTPDPGLRHRVDVVFERPTGGLEGAVLSCQPAELILAHSRQLAIGLGIDAARAHELEATTTALPVELLASTEVIS